MLGALRRYRRRKAKDNDGELKSLMAIVQSRVYNATLEIFEDQERDGKIAGNGHHMAQKAAKEAAKILYEHWWIA